jgi:flagella basal body P-ring formation protein FlgA
MALAAALAFLLAAGPAEADSGSPATILPPEAVADLARAWLAEQAGPGALVTVRPPTRPLTVAAGLLSFDIRLESGDLNGPGATVRVTAISQGAGERDEASALVRAAIRRRVSVLVAARALGRGALLDADDVRVEPRAPSAVPADALTDPEAVVGRELAHPLAPGEVLTARVVRSRRLVRRGTPVTLRAEGRGFTVTAAGVAEEDGAPGDTVRVRNRASRKPVQGVVDDDGSVRVAY